MTKQQETDIGKTVSSYLRWSIGLSVTIVLFIVGMKIAEVRKDAQFKGEIKTEVTIIKEDIKEINQKIDKEITEVREEEKERNKNESDMLKEMYDDLNHIEFFLAKKLDYDPVIRSASYEDKAD